MRLIQLVAASLTTGAMLVVIAQPSPAQTRARAVHHRRRETLRPDSTRPVRVVKWPTVAVLPGALLPASRIIAFYGNPLSAGMGILGAMPPAAMLDKLASTAAAWQRADSTHPVRPALQLIATVAQGHKGPDGLYRVRHSDSLIAKVAGWAESRDWLMFLDVQIGWSTVPAELQRLIPDEFPARNSALSMLATSTMPSTCSPGSSMRNTCRRKCSWYTGSRTTC